MLNVRLIVPLAVTLTEGFNQLFQVNTLRDQGVRLFARCGQPLLISLRNVVGKVWAPANMPQPIFSPLHKQGSELLLGSCGSPGVQRDPFDGLVPSVILNGDPGDIFAVASPKAPNCVLAIVQNLRVFVSA
jgi:hypothetical protein